MRRSFGSEDAQVDLFPDLAVTNWFPDETLFSLVSRHHRLSGNVLVSATCSQIFGHPQQGSAHDFPSRIDEFVRRTHGAFGDTEYIIRHHTILPFFLPFRSQHDADNAIAAMRGSGIGSLKFSLGLLTSRFRAHHPLKACLECMAEDEVRFGTAYWHRAHQLPGTWACLSHGSQLMESVVKSTGVERFGWHLPSIQILRCSTETGRAISADDLTIFQRIATSALCVANLPRDFMFDPLILLNAYDYALREKQMLRGASGHRKLDAICPSFLGHITPLRQLAEFQALPNSVDEARSQIARLLTFPRTGTHPIRHLVLIDWLFGSWNGFWEVYRNAGHIRQTSAEDCSPKIRPDSKKNRFIDLVTDGALSVSAAGAQLHIDPATAMVWAASASIKTKRRAKLLKPDLLAKVIKALYRGADKEKVAQQFDISVSTVTRILRTEIGLQCRWHEVRDAKARTRARKNWLNVLRNNPNTSLKTIRLLEPAAYAWLYRNDKAWLAQQASEVAQTARKGNHSKVDWNKRDSILAQKIEVAALYISNQNPGQPIKLWAIYQQVPELKAKLSKIENFPLTSQALKLAITRRVREKPGGSSEPKY